MKRLLLKVANKGLYANEVAGIGKWETWEPLPPSELPSLDLPPVAPTLPPIAAGWHRPPPRPGQGTRSRAVDDLLQKHGIETRPRVR